MSDAARYHVVHETIYRYDSPVSISRQLLHLAPRPCAWQTCLEHTAHIDPQPSLDETRIDAFGNPVRQFTIESPHSSLLVRAESRIEGGGSSPRAAFSAEKIA